MNHLNSFIRHLGGTLILTLSLPLFSQTLKDLGPWTQTPGEQPDCVVFLEGEAFVQQEGGKVLFDDKCYGGKNWTLLSKSGGGNVTYGFRVLKKGMYLIAIAGQEFGTGWTSPVSYALDDSEKWILALKSPVSSNSWGASKSIKWTFLATPVLEAGNHTLQLKVDKTRPMDASFAYAVDAVAVVLEPFGKVVPNLLNPRDVSAFVIRPGEKSTLEWQVSPITKTEHLAIKVIDYRGNMFFEGSAILDGETARLDLKMDSGYWEIEFPILKKSFGVISVPEKKVLDPFFGIDSGLSWLY